MIQRLTVRWLGMVTKVLAVLVATAGLLAGQGLPRHYLGYGFPQVPYLETQVAPLAATPDGGYLLSAGYQWQGLHGRLMGGQLVKLDGNLNAVWRRGTPEEGGHACYVGVDGSVLYYTSDQSVTCHKLLANGQVAWAKVVARTGNRRYELAQVDRVGGRMVLTGTAYLVDNGGYTLTQDPVQLVTDSLGNVLWADSLVLPGMAYNYVADAAAGGSGETYLVGTHGDLWQSVAWLARLDSNRTLGWAYTMTATGGRVEWGGAQVLGNADLLLCGRWVEDQTGGTQLLLARLDPGGGVKWVRRLGLAGRMTMVVERPGGDLLCVGMDGSTAYSAVVVRVRGTGEVLWCKRYGLVSGLGPPLVRGANDWWVPGVGAWAFTLQTDSNLVAGGCAPVPVAVVVDSPVVTLAPLAATVHAHTMGMVATSVNAVNTVTTRDSCFGMVVGVNEVMGADVSVYPNPSSGRVRVTAAGGVVAVVAMDAWGRCLGEVAVDGNGWSVTLPRAGVYWLRVVVADGSVVVRTVVVR